MYCEEPTCLRYRRGLGAVICEKFALEGANIAINYANRKEPADDLAEKLKQYGTKVVVIKAVCSPLQSWEGILITLTRTVG